MSKHVVAFAASHTLTTDLHRHSAIDDYRFASDKVVGHQHPYCVRNVFRSALAMEWNPHRKIVGLGFGTHRVVKARANDARGDTIHANIVIGLIPRKAAGELEHGPFDNSVCNVTGNTANTGNRGDKDNRRIPCFPQSGQRATAKKIGAVYVHIKCSHPLFWWTLIDPAQRCATGRMHENIQPSKLRDCFVDKSVRVFLPGYVADDRHTLLASRFDRLTDFACGGVIVTAIDGDIAAVSREVHRN
jgi:hypothetical protein